MNAPLPPKPKVHGECREYLRLMALTQRDTDITVSTVAPLVAGPYTTAPFICPHGVRHWIEPTGEQIAQWAKDGVR